MSADEDADDVYETLVNNGIGLGIANLITRWAQSELQLKVILLEMELGRSIRNEADLVGLIPFMGMDARAVLGLIKTMSVNRLGEAGSKSVAKILDRINAAKDLRDYVSHATWQQRTPTKAGDQRMIARLTKSVGKLKHDKRVIAPKDLFNTSKALAHHMDELIEFPRSFGYCEQFEEWCELSS